MKPWSYLWIGFTSAVLAIGLLEILRHFYVNEELTTGWTHMAGGAILGVLAFGFSSALYQLRGNGKTTSSRQPLELIELHRDAERQNAQLAALSHAALTMTSDLSSEAVFQHVIDLARDVAGAQYSALAVLDANGNVESFLTSGISEEVRGRLGHPPTMKEGLLAVPIQNKMPLRVPSISGHPRSVGFPAGHPPMERFLGIPVVFQGKTVGQLYLTNEASAKEFSSEDEEVMTLFARQAAVAIENSRLYRQVQALAALEERERISRDLHDMVIQSLYALGLRLGNVVQTANTSPAQMAEQISYSVEKLDEVIRDLRVNILGLHLQVYYGKGLKQGLEDLVTEFQLNAFVRVHMTLPDDLDRPLSSQQRVELLHVTREAMTNILKHAQAQEVTVGGNQTNELVKLVITDDGQGFDPLAPRSKDRQGIRNMEARVLSAGGWMEISSILGEGTTVEVSIPARENDPLE